MRVQSLRRGAEARKDPLIEALHQVAEEHDLHFVVAVLDPNDPNGQCYSRAAWINRREDPESLAEGANEFIRAGTFLTVAGARLQMEAAEREPRAPGCLCHIEVGDSPCPVHGEDET